MAQCLVKLCLVCAEEDKEVPATHACYDCKEENPFFCTTCNTEEHGSSVTSTHKRVLIGDYFSVIDEYIPTEDDFLKDAANIFIKVDESAELVLGNKFYFMKEGEELKDNELLPVVSVVGSAGAGKSMLVRQCCKEGLPKPLCGAAKETAPISADIHAYIGTLQTKTPRDILFLDSEGTSNKNEQPLDLLSRSKALAALQQLSSFRAPPINPEHRSDFVNNAFPRILYMCSTVYVFMYAGPVQSEQIWMDSLTSYVNHAAAATVNQVTLPVLIFVFNKVPKDAGLWDIDAATKALNIGTRFEEVFRAVHIVHIPDRDSLTAQYAIQVAALKTLIANCIDAQQLYPRQTVMQLFATAVREFSTNTAAAFDFMDVAIKDRPLPKLYAKYMEEFFVLVNTYYKEQKHMTPQDAFENAAAVLSDRVLNSFLHHLVRNQIYCPLGISKAFELEVAKLDDLICRFIPCTATTTQFNRYNLAVVQCCSTLGNREGGTHGAQHQSTQTYVHYVPHSVLLFRLLGERTRISQACRWEGPIKINDKYTKKGWFFDATVLAGKVVTAEDYFVRFKSILDNQKIVLSGIKSTRLCLACLLAIPSHVLPCDHMLCSRCWLELHEGNKITCPFCNQKQPWTCSDVPDGAGFRLLSIDGGGIRGIVSTLVLQRIENMLQISICQLFDLIVGTSAGGLNAMGFGILRKDGQSMANAFQDLSSTAFVTRFGGLLVHILSGYKYLRAPLQKALAEFMDSYAQRPMVGSSQYSRVAVVAAEVTNGEPKPVLFTSYLPSSQPTEYRHEIRGSVLDAAQATTAAGTYFPIFTTTFGTFTDGGIVANNPVEIAYNEGSSLWPNKSPDLILSIGTGKWEGQENLHDEIVGFLRLAIKSATNSEAAWKRIADRYEGKVRRINPDLEKEYALDDTAHIKQLKAHVTNYINREQGMFGDIANILLAKLFYIAPPDIKHNAQSVVLPVLCRVDSVQALTQYNDRIPPFSVDVTVNGAKRKNAIGEVRKQASGKYSIVISGVQQGETEVRVFSHLSYDSRLRLSEGIPISGKPIMFKR